MHSTDPSEYVQDGGCTCGHVRYRMTSAPLIVHCCHCRWCQRETGTAFALNAMIEADRVQLLEGEVQVIDTPSNSGKQLVSTGTPAARRAPRFKRLSGVEVGNGLDPSGSLRR